MTETMAERVARAICETHGVDPNRVANVSEVKGFDAPIVRAWEVEVAAARTILKAMRKPTDAMTDGGIASGAVSNDDYYIQRYHMEAVWEAMIDAALAAPKGKDD